jgi:hypothetical protein
VQVHLVEQHQRLQVLAMRALGEARDIEQERGNVELNPLRLGIREILQSRIAAAV